MNEFMTKVSDYFSERRNDPEKNGNPLVLCMLGVVILVIIILCLILLWRKSSGQKEFENSKKSGESEIRAETYKEVPETRLAGPDESELLKQQYLTNIEYLREKVESLLSSLSKIKETLEETIHTNKEENSALHKQIEEIMGDIGDLVTRLSNTENYMYDLTDMIRIMNEETLPVIREQIDELKAQMSQVNTDISGIYKKIGALETSDADLQAKLRELEGSLKASVEQNLTDITNRFENMNTQIKQVEMQIGDVETRISSLETRIEDIQTKIQQMVSGSLHYRYDKATNTLYLRGQ
ncbi:MAG: hypothetical protein HFI48_13245 [Lachnospiraceae bacterium]|mgnify:FL=1|nr:hypothetical protein [Lachnospiraceae bacterium]